MAPLVTPPRKKFSPGPAADGVRRRSPSPERGCAPKARAAQELRRAGGKSAPEAPLMTTTDRTRATCRHLRRPEGTYAGKQGFDYREGISAESAGAAGICMHLLEIPP